MTVPLRTFGLLGLAVAMLGAGYLFVPSPGASPLPTPAAKTADAVPSAPAPQSAAPPSAVPPGKPPAALAASRPPVPLLAPAHHNYYVLKEPAAKAATADKSDKDKPTTGNSPSTDVQQASASEPKSADGPQQAVAVDTKPGADSKAKAAVEQDGYRNVSGLVKQADGTWRGRAMRGRTEIAIRVNPDGSVSQD